MEKTSVCVDTAVFWDSIQVSVVRTIRPVDGARDFSGTLEQYNNGEITVRLTSGKALCVQKKDTAFVKLDDFNIADFEQDFQG